jgi:hypothetical protein
MTDKNILVAYGFSNSGAPLQKANNHCHFELDADAAWSKARRA